MPCCLPGVSSGRSKQTRQVSQMSGKVGAACHVYCVWGRARGEIGVEGCVAYTKLGVNKGSCKLMGNGARWQVCVYQSGATQMCQPTNVSWWGGEAGKGSSGSKSLPGWKLCGGGRCVGKGAPATINAWPKGVNGHQGSQWNMNRTSVWEYQAVCGVPCVQNETGNQLTPASHVGKVRGQNLTVSLCIMGKCLSHGR